ncbi:MAG TPA: site-specific integrase, partial [Chitinophagaceae bacterium]|nr:site-specific integrase [Chitinophagaceae bacterium]
IIEFNQDLNSLKMDIRKIEKGFEINGIPYSSEMVVEKLKEIHNSKTKKEDHANLLFDFIDRYIKDHRTTREAGSLAVYNSLKNHLQRFQKDRKKNVTFESIDYKFFQDFQNYLLKERTDDKGKIIKGLNNTTVAKQLSTVKTFLNYARMHGVSSISQSHKDFKIKKETLEVIALTNEEFERLYYLDLTENKRLDQICDVFCFACTTGLRYSDLKQIRREHIKADEIRITVKKTKELLSVPLTSFSVAILNKYKSYNSPLPVISNQKMNEYLKELCKLAEINEEIEIVRFTGAKRITKVYPKHELIGVHTGRKTFVTLSLEKGMSAEEVMTITGHKDYKSFSRYVKITEQRKKVVMRNAWGTDQDSEIKSNLIFHIKNNHHAN